MNSDLPEVLLLYQPGRSGPGLMGLLGEYSPGGSCSSFLPCAAEIKKLLWALLACRESISTLPAQLIPEQGGQHLPSPSSTLGLARGLYPSFWEGHPSCQRRCFRVILLPQEQLDVALRSKGCVQGSQGHTLALRSHPTCVPHSPGCQMNIFANVGL